MIWKKLQKKKKKGEGISLIVRSWADLKDDQMHKSDIVN